MNQMTDEEKIRIRKRAEELLRELSKRGKVVEGGWEAYVICSLSHCPPIQLAEMRKAFFFGAQHVFSSIINLTGNSPEPTEDEMKVMSDISDELRKFIEGIIKE